MLNILSVGAGGCIGAIFRYLLSLMPYKGTFPLWTLLTNFMGAILIGFIVGLASDKMISSRSTLFWKTGVCGGFTTFSTFSLEALQLLEKGKIVSGGIYILLSVGLCLVGVYAGRRLAQIMI